MTFYAYSFPNGRFYGGAPDVYSFDSKRERDCWVDAGPQNFGDAGYRQASFASGKYVVLAKRERTVNFYPREI